MIKITYLIKKRNTLENKSKVFFEMCSNYILLYFTLYKKLAKFTVTFVETLPHIRLASR